MKLLDMYTGTGSVAKEIGSVYAGAPNGLFVLLANGFEKGNRGKFVGRCCDIAGL